MKAKLIVIAVLALLLCAAMPMAATAANEKTTFDTKLYAATWDGSQWVQGKSFGKVTFDKDANTYTIKPTGAKLEPGTYNLVVTQSSTDLGPSPIVGRVTVDENGRVQSATDQPILFDRTSAEVAGWLDAGGWVFIDLSFPL